MTGPQHGSVVMAPQILPNPYSFFQTFPDGQNGGAMLQHVFSSGTTDVELNALNFLKLLDHNSGRTNITTTEVLSLALDPGTTLLHLSASLGFSKLLRDLVTRKATLDRQDNNGNTPLHVAALYDQQMCAQILVDSRADTTIVDLRGRTPREIALQYDRRAIANMLGDRTAGLSIPRTSAVFELNGDTRWPPRSRKRPVISLLKTTVKELIRPKNYIVEMTPSPPNIWTAEDVTGSKKHNTDGMGPLAMLTPPPELVESAVGLHQPAALVAKSQAITSTTTVANRYVKAYKSV